MGCGEGDAYVLGSGVAVELSGCDQDAQPGQVVNRSVALLITGGPQVDRALRVLDPEASCLQRWSQHGPAPEIPRPLQLNVIMITEQFDHRLLNRARYQHPGMLANRKQVRDDVSITGDEARTVAGHIGAFGERVHRKQVAVATSIDRRVQPRNRLRFPAELSVALVGSKQGSTLPGPVHPILEPPGIEDSTSRICR